MLIKIECDLCKEVEETEAMRNDECEDQNTFKKFMIGESPVGSHEICVKCNKCGREVKLYG